MHILMPEPEGVEPNDTPDSVWVPFDRIEVHPAGYQRPYDDERSRKMAKEWDPSLFNPPKLSPNPQKPGWFSCWDGQHEIGALRYRGQAGCPCIIRDLPVTEQARAFREGQPKRKNLTVIDDWHASLVQGDPTDKAISAILERLGLFVPRTAAGSRPGPRADGRLPIRAINGVRSVARHGLEHLQEVLTVLLDAWGYDVDTVTLPMLQGMSLFLRIFPEVSRIEIARKLGRTLTARALVLAAQSQQQGLGYRMQQEAARTMLHAYNKGRRSGALDERRLIVGAPDAS